MGRGPQRFTISVDLPDHPHLWPLQFYDRILKAHSHSMSARVFPLEIRQSATFFRNVSMAYSAKGYSVVKKAIYKIRCSILNVFFSRTHTKLSVSELLEYGAYSCNSRQHVPVWLWWPPTDYNKWQLSKCAYSFCGTNYVHSAFNCKRNGFLLNSSWLMKS